VVQREEEVASRKLENLETQKFGDFLKKSELVSLIGTSSLFLCINKR